MDPDTLDWPDLPEISLSDAAGRLSSVSEQSRARAIYLTRRGRPVAALVNPVVLARLVADAEELADKSPEWQRLHSYGRQVIESFNYSLKHADNGLADSTSRRKRGEAGQAFLVLLGVIATNAARILDSESQFFDGVTPAPDALTRHARSARPVSARPRASRKAMSASRKAQLGLAAG